MNEQYEFPDDPEVFARVLQHFRDTSVAHWEARMARYASEARKQSSVTQISGVISAATTKKAASTAVRSRKSKRTRPATAK